MRTLLKFKETAIMNMSVKFLWTVSFAAFFLSACGLMGVNTRRAEIPVQNVPYQAREGDDLRKKLLVLPFLDSDPQRSRSVVEIARRTVVESLVGSGNFLVVNNSDVPQSLGGFTKDDGGYDMAALSRMAAQMGVAAVVEGRILEISARRIGDEIGLFRKLKAQAEVTVQIRVFGAKTSHEIYASDRKVMVESETTRVGESSYSDRFLQEDPALVSAGVRKAFKETVGGIVKAVEKLSWEGRVALVSGDKIYINAGRLSGIQIGDILRITEEGEEIFDPDSGSFIGTAPGRMKGTVEVVSYFGKDGAIAVVHSGTGFQENDKIQLY